jgi:hypothetical protein
VNMDGLGWLPMRGAQGVLGGQEEERQRIQAQCSGGLGLAGQLRAFCAASVPMGSELGSGA